MNPVVQLPLIARRLPADGAGEPAPGADLLLVGCVRAKVGGDARVPVRNLYTSILWGLRRRYAEAREVAHGVAWGVVSAGLGVVAPGQRARPYEATARDLVGSARQAWLARARHAIMRRLWRGPIMVSKVIEVVAGAAYVSLVREAVEGLPAIVVSPLTGFGIGQRQGWMKRTAAAILGAAAVEESQPAPPTRQRSSAVQSPLFPRPISYFASGSNLAGEIQGFAQIGVHVGVAVDRINAESVWALKQLAGSGVRVFIDSGAFSEVAFGATGPTVVKPITHLEWLDRLGVMRDLAKTLGSQAYIVAPDKVGYRGDSLARLRRYAPQVREMRAFGARVIVPIQKGVRSMADFDAAAAEALGFDDFVRGAPMRHRATSVAELREFLKCRCVGALHLLGLGPNSVQFPAVARMLRSASPHTVVTMDSVKIRAAVGRTNGPGGGPRALTAATDVERTIISESVWGGDYGLADYTDEIACPSWWAGPTALRRIARKAGLSRADARAFVRDPDGFLAERGIEWNMSGPLDDEWARWFMGTGTVGAVKRRSIVRAFGSAA